MWYIDRLEEDKDERAKKQIYHILKEVTKIEIMKIPRCRAIINWRTHALGTGSEIDK